MNINKRNTFLSRLTKYKYLIIVPAIIAGGILLSNFAYTSYMNNKANNNSLLFNSIQESLMQGNEDAALVLLNKLEKNGTIGYQLISYLQQASLSINNKEYTKAIKILGNIHQINVPKYYKDLANYIVFSIRLDHDKDIHPLITSIEKISTPDDAFYVSNLEILAIAYYLTKNYEKSLSNLDKIINESKVPNGLQERAKSLKTLVLSYVK